MLASIKTEPSSPPHNINMSSSSSISPSSKTTSTEVTPTKTSQMSMPSSFVVSGELYLENLKTLNELKAQICMAFKRQAAKYGDEVIEHGIWGGNPPSPTLSSMWLSATHYTEQQKDLTTLLEGKLVINRDVVKPLGFPKGCRRKRRRRHVGTFKGKELIYLSSDSSMSD